MRQAEIKIHIFLSTNSPYVSKYLTSCILSPLAMCSLSSGKERPSGSNWRDALWCQSELYPIVLHRAAILFCSSFYSCLIHSPQHNFNSKCASLGCGLGTSKNHQKWQHSPISLRRQYQKCCIRMWLCTIVGKTNSVPFRHDFIAWINTSREQGTAFRLLALHLSVTFMSLCSQWNRLTNSCRHNLLVSMNVANRIPIYSDTVDFPRLFCIFLVDHKKFAPESRQCRLEDNNDFELKEKQIICVGHKWTQNPWVPSTIASTNAAKSITVCIPFVNGQVTNESLTLTSILYWCAGVAWTACANTSSALVCVRWWCSFSLLFTFRCRVSLHELEIIVLLFKQYCARNGFTAS